jgi:CarD family transcriptional regulator
MFKVNDYVMYKAVGACKIIDIIKDKDINNNEVEYYVLQPAFKNNLTAKVPVNNPNVNMRRVITKDDVLDLIKSIPETETVWIDNNKERSDSFKTALKSGESEEWVKLIKTIYQERQEKSDLGKKLWKTDEDIMKAAEKNLYEEFAIALNISPEEVPEYIHKHIQK